MDRHNTPVTVVDDPLLEYSYYARAINAGKISKDYYLKLRGLPDECRLLRPDVVVQSAQGRHFVVYKMPIWTSAQKCGFSEEYIRLQSGKYKRLLDFTIPNICLQKVGRPAIPRLRNCQPRSVQKILHNYCEWSRPFR
jgi:hypothetical protein